MSREEVAAALDRAAEALAEAALALRDSAGAGSAPSRPAPAPAQAAGSSGPAAAPLGACPVHHVAWTVKDGGISKNGKPYPAFWRCNEKDANGYCSQRPVKGWADSHPIQMDAVA